MVKQENKKYNEPIVGYRIYLEGKPIGLDTAAEADDGKTGAEPCTVGNAENA